jgi:hypothetical protein
MCNTIRHHYYYHCFNLLIGADALLHHPKRFTKLKSLCCFQFAGPWTTNRSRDAPVSHTTKQHLSDMIVLTGVLSVLFFTKSGALLFEGVSRVKF